MTSVNQKILIIPDELILKKIFFLRGKKIMFDKDLAELYGVETKVLNQAVKRNIMRFPPDFMFQLNLNEIEILRSQIVTSNWGGRRYFPFAFTEHGVAMLSSILNSDRAIQVNIHIIRNFIELRELLSTHENLRRKIETMEKKYNQQFTIVFKVIKQLLEDESTPKPSIGFKL